MPFQLKEYLPPFPLEIDLYEVAPSLKLLEKTSCHFNIDQEWHKARQNKIEGMKEKPSKYVLRHNFDPDHELLIALKILDLLKAENPDYFQSGQSQELFCNLSKEHFKWNELGKITFSSTPSYIGASLLDALMGQVSEDLAVVRKHQEQDYLSYLNVFSPSHWAPEHKIGQSFFAVHDVIPNSKKLTQVSNRVVEAMIHRGPFERSVWSFVTDERLNHHPEPPAGMDPTLWKGRSFDLQKKEPFILRVERQTTLGMPEIDSALFTIRIGFIPGSKVKANATWRHRLIGQIRSMDERSKEYKGVLHCHQELIEYLSTD